MKPISPDEVQKKFDADIPEWIIEAFNALIKENWDGRASKFTQDDVLDRAINYAEVHGATTTRGQIIKMHWLDVENVYSEIGWDVTYDSPSYGDSDFRAFFLFKKNN